MAMGFRTIGTFLRPEHARRNKIVFVLWLVIAISVIVLSLNMARDGLRVMDPESLQENPDGSPTESFWEKLRTMSFWHKWESIALGSGFVYSFFFFLVYWASKPSLWSYLDWKEQYVCYVGLFGGWALLGGGWSMSVGEYYAVGSGLYLLTAAMMCFGIVDYVFAYQAHDSEEDSDKVKKEKQDSRQGFKMAFWFTDIPVILGFATLGAFVAVLTGSSKPAMPPPELQAFVAGSIAFQLLASIIVFGILFWLPLVLPDRKLSIADDKNEESDT